MTNHSSPLILVDGSSYLYRAFYACPPLTNKNGEPTGAMYGVFNMLKSLLMQYQPTHIAVVFDAKGKTFRDALFSEYKANRQSMPEDLCPQVEPLHNLLRALGLPVFVIEGVEADDVIGTLAMQAHRKNIPVIISTGDKDMAQLVTENVTLINTMTNSVLTVDGVKEKYTIPPELIIDYLALMGDKSDNIPGVSGIGEKTAQTLLQHFAGLDAIYANIDKIVDLPIRGAKSVQKKLINDQQMAKLSYQLATIHTDVKLNIDVNSLNISAPDIPTLRHLFEYYGFSRWLKEIDSNAFFALQNGKNTPSSVEESSSSALLIPSVPEKIDANYEIIDTESKLEKWLTQLSQATCFAFDTETDRLDYMTANLVGVSFCIEAGKAAYLPLQHQHMGDISFDIDAVLSRLKPILENPAIKKIGQNIKFDMSIMARYDIILQGIAFDTMLEAYVINSLGRHDMDTLANQYLNRQTTSFEAIAGKGKKQLTFDQVDLDIAAHYAAEDADITLQLHNTLMPMLESVPDLQHVLNELEMPLVPILSKMERDGVLIDTAKLAEHSYELEQKLQLLEQEAYHLAGEPFNLASPKQLQTIFYEKLQLPVLKKTPKGAPSTNEEVLIELAANYPLPKILLEYRGLAKLKNTYTDTLPQMISPVDGRVHTSYHQAITATGRLSSSEPNLQNIPIRNDEGRRIRQAFIAEKDHCLISADYSQIELRIMSHLSDDAGLLEAFAKDKDIHLATAAEVLNINEKQVTTEQRRFAKAINFGLIYGMSEFGLAKQLNISRTDAQAYMARYFKKYTGVLHYMEHTRQQAAENGYVQTLCGRRLYLPDITSSNAMLRKAAERAAINAPMQGTAADIIKRAMIDIDHWLTNTPNMKIKMIMQVHDELIFEVLQNQVEEASQMIQQLMENCFTLKVPLKVDVGIGENWGDAH